jgi:predicted RNA-binding Zn ribbon-like protein
MPDALPLVVDLVNTVDRSAGRVDRLDSVQPVVDRLRLGGWPRLAASLGPDDLPGIVALRERLRSVFRAESAQQAADVLNELLAGAGAVARLVPGGPIGMDLHAVGPAAGVAGLQALLADALARHVARHGVSRLGVCRGSPCECVFVDRTKAVRQRYCCGLCSDRVAAAAYRRRRSGPAAVPPVPSAP